ncbi:glucose 1-dehydrogenase [Sulfitobacter sp. 916]|nr:glucose 1-dehydrogenase [Sulfitobacter sp.]
MGKLTGKTAVITGGNSGIGLSTAKTFIDEGAQVVIFGRDQKSLDDAVETLGDNAIGVQGNVTQDADLKRLFSATNDRFGKVDILFANAGVADFAPVAQAGEDHFDKVFDVNVKGVFKTVQHSIDVLNDGASVVLTTSVSNTKGMAGMSAYAASKAAVRSFARSFSGELLARGIRVNAISPGPVATPIYARAGMSEAEIDAMGEGMADQIPLKRFAEPREIATAALFLASGDSSYVVGTELVVDGGWTQV